MRRVAGLPGWALLLVWVAVPAIAVVLVVMSLRAGDDSGGTQGSANRGLGEVTIDVQTPALVRQREAAGIPDCSSVSAGTTGGAVDGGLPDVTLPCLGADDVVDLADLRGPAVVNLWAQNCGPCRAEMPLLQRLHASAPGVSVVGVDFLDVRPDLALVLARQSGVTYPSVADVDARLKAPLRLTGLPLTLFVDAQGQVVGQQSGAFTSYAELTAAVADHLGVGG